MWMVAEGSEEQALPLLSTASCYLSYHVIFLPCNFSLRCRIQRLESGSHPERAELLCSSAWLLLGLTPPGCHCLTGRMSVQSRFKLLLGLKHRGWELAPGKALAWNKTKLEQKDFRLFANQSWLLLKFTEDPFLKCPIPIFCAQAQHKWKIFCFHWRCNCLTDSDKLLTERSLSRGGNVCVSSGTARCVSSPSYQLFLWGYNRFITPHFCTNTPHNSGTSEEPRMFIPVKYLGYWTE